MNASWMLASIVAALLLAVSATALEKAVALRRGAPLRWVWAGAMVLSIGLPASWLRSPSPATHDVMAGTTRPANTSVRAATPPSAPVEARADIARPFAATRSALDRARAAVVLPRLPRRFESAVRRAWLFTSAAFLCLLLAASLRLFRDRRSWHAATVLDAAVFVSDEFGPAIVGLVRPVIVVPAWVLALDAAAQRTIVLHEEEHRRAGDPRLLHAALALLLLMPWNLGLWLMWRRLRRAIELDCDERVLARGVRGGDYANVLLDAWQRVRGTEGWLPSAAFAERASGLGRRVEHLMRPEPRRRAMKIVSGSIVAAMFVAAAMLVPAPQGAQEVAAAMQSTPFPLILIDGVKRRDIVDGKGNQAALDQLMAVRHDTVTLWQMVDSAKAVLLYGADGVHGASALWTGRYLRNGGAILPKAVVHGEASPRADPSTTVEQFASRMYANLFSGVSLSTANEAKAHAIILDYQVAQHALKGPYLVIWPKRLALDSVRDARVHALLANAADRASYDAKAEQGPARRVQTPQEVARNESFNYVYQVPVTDAEHAKILAVLVQSLIDEARLFERAPADSASRNALLAKRTADVRAILGTDAERDAFDKRRALLHQVHARP